MKFYTFLPDCNLEVSRFKLHLCYYVHFQTSTYGKGMNYFIPPAMDWIIPQLVFYKNGFGIK